MFSVIKYCGSDVMVFTMVYYDVYSTLDNHTGIFRQWCIIVGEINIIAKNIQATFPVFGFRSFPGMKSLIPHHLTLKKDVIKHH